MSEHRIYVSSTKVGAIRQGELISGLIEPRATNIPSSDPVGNVEFSLRSHPLAVVLTQDCDLEGDYRARIETPLNEKKMLPSLLFCEVFLSEDLRPVAQGVGIDSKRWKVLKQNNEPRFHFLQAVPCEVDACGEGFPSLALDFNRIFSLNPELLYSQLENRAARRFRMNSPYFEHLASRFFAYIGRVALPEPHITD